MIRMTRSHVSRVDGPMAMVSTLPVRPPNGPGSCLTTTLLAMGLLTEMVLLTEMEIVTSRGLPLALLTATFLVRSMKPLAARALPSLS